MPSRKLTDRCPKCHCKNHLRSLFCSQCGTKLNDERAVKDHEGRAKLYADIAHPINSDCREMIQRRVLETFEEEIISSKNSNYVCTYDDYGEDRFATLREPEDVETPEVLTETDDASHRIEPAASQPGPPHHQIPAPTRQTEPAAFSGDTRRDGDQEEGFGAGIG